MSAFLPRMQDRTRILIGRSTAVSIAVVGTASAATYLFLGRADELYGDWILHNGLLGSIGLGVLTWLAVGTQPRNGVVWALMWSALFQTLNAAAQAASVLAAESAGIADRMYQLPSSQIPLEVRVPQYMASWTWIPGVFLMVTLVPLLFPDGRLPNPRWRPVAWAAPGAMVLASAALIGLTLNTSDTEPLTKDLALPGWVQPLFLVLFAVAAASFFALIGRYRRSEGEERIQFRWVVWGAGVFAVGSLTLLVDLTTGADAFRLASLVAGLIWLAALTVAITKHRLYDIDLVVNKTLAAGVVAAVLAALYVAVVVGVGSVVGSGDETAVGFQVIGTAIVAVAFGPVRRRAQQWANRRVYGMRVTPYEVLARFSHRAARAADDDLLTRIPRLIVEGTAATEAILWVRFEGGFRAAATWPEPVSRSPVAATDTFEDPDGDHSMPVFHDGEVLGGISVVTARGEALPPAEEQLVASLAAGMGLALRNAGLTAQLREQVVRLEVSRERILAAADEARRALERDLDSGPQQQLVALKVMLGPIRKQAATAGAARTAEVLAQLESDAGEAIDAVREFATGVYPPLLEAEGLTVAITQQVARAATPITVDDGGIGRHSREIEAAVYFTVLEALQNTAKYASASSATVTLREADGTLRFEVADDGVGFDPATVKARSGLANMADRLDAVGGSLTVDSSPGAGASVRGMVPIEVNR